MTSKTIIVAILTLAIMSIMTLGVMARVATPNSLTPPARSLLGKKQLDIACVKAAVEKRENAIQAAWDKFSSSIKSSLETRKTELLAAWDITDKFQRRKAIQAAWQKFRRSRIEARRTLDQTRRQAWKQFSIDRALCGSGPTGEDQGIDISL